MKGTQDLPPAKHPCTKVAKLDNGASKPVSPRAAEPKKGQALCPDTPGASRAINPRAAAPGSLRLDRACHWTEAALAAWSVFNAGT